MIRCLTIPMVAALLCVAAAPAGDHTETRRMVLVR